MDKKVYVYTDGSCLGNPGPGGWGVLLVYEDKTKELSGGEPDTTNNRMELMAAIRGLEALNKRADIVLTTDSQYVRLGITEWIIQWKKRGWKTAARKPVKNQDLWQRLDEQVQLHQVDWRWVKAHSGHPENERVDDLAQQAADAQRKAGK